MWSWRKDSTFSSAGACSNDKDYRSVCYPGVCGYPVVGPIRLPVEFAMKLSLLGSMMILIAQTEPRRSAKYVFTGLGVVIVLVGLLTGV